MSMDSHPVSTTGRTVANEDKILGSGLGDTKASGQMSSFRGVE